MVSRYTVSICTLLAHAVLQPKRVNRVTMMVSDVVILEEKDSWANYICVLPKSHILHIQKVVRILLQCARISSANLLCKYNKNSLIKYSATLITHSFDHCELNLINEKIKIDVYFLQNNWTFLVLIIRKRESYNSAFEGHENTSTENIKKLYK